MVAAGAGRDRGARGEVAEDLPDKGDDYEDASESDYDRLPDEGDYCEGASESDYDALPDEGDYCEGASEGDYEGDCCW